MKFIIVIFTVCSAIILNAQDEYNLDEIVVSGGRTPSTILNTTKNILLILGVILHCDFNCYVVYFAFTEDNFFV